MTQKGKKMTRTVPLSYTINVSVSTTPSGLGEYNSNSICLLTNETPLSTQPYIWAVNAQDAINEYGTDSLTAKMAQALFLKANIRHHRLSYLAKQAYLKYRINNTKYTAQF